MGAGYLTQREKRRLRLVILLIGFIILVADQVLKFWVKTNMHLGEDIPFLGNWGILHFTENNGIAFGLEPSSEGMKLALSLFRIITVGALIYLLAWLIRNGRVSRGFAIGLGIICAGAIGNIIDGTFYGLLFSSSDGLVFNGTALVPAVAEFLPEGGGYAPLFHGKVVDMFYFPIIDFIWPEWVPWFGGSRFLFFQPVFNVADAAITCGTFYLLIFHWKVFFGKRG